MITQPTIQQTLDYIICNRKGNAFKDYSSLQIASLLNECSSTNAVLTAGNEKGQLCGVVCAIAYPQQKKIFIHDILTTERWVISHFVAHFVLTYSGWSLEAMRRNKFVEYNTMKLTSKILKKASV